MSTLQLLTPQNIQQAHQRIAPHVHHTPVLESHTLNRWLGHRVLFKAECMQKIGAFKYRGAMNTLLSLHEKGVLPKEVVALSSGNHAQAVALAAREFGIAATIIMPGFTSPVKIQATKSYGADVVLTPTRAEAEEKVKEYVARGMEYIPPYDRDEIIAGQGTACFEALQEHKVDAVFATCGGGGLLSGTLLASLCFTPAPLVFGAEPLKANDAAQSLRKGSIVRLESTPETIADGATTLSISERTFHYLKQLAGFYEITEEAMIYWTQWITHLLKITPEPTSAAAMAAAAIWLSEQTAPKTALVIISGGNIAPEAHRKIWAANQLEHLPGSRQN